jgi:shikimate dehydrogenase
VLSLFANPIDASTRFCAVYGYPIRHSASPAMHNPAMAELGLNWRYLAFEVHPDNLRTAIAGAKAMKFVGLNLTVPHKLLALEMVEALDESARTWGAVNTIRFEAKEGGEWQPLHAFAEPPNDVRAHGFNTITRALREDLKFEPRGKSVLLLGAGGAGRVAALKLAQEGVGELHLVNRTTSKAEQLAGELKGIRVHVGYPKNEVDLVLNATSLGLKASDALPVDPKAFALSRATAAYDMIYRPAQTAFLRAAAEAGCRTANGLGMLLYQGAKALELWTGKIAPISIMREALMKNVYGSSS